MGSDKTQDIVLQGPELLGEHCVVENCAGAVTLIPQDGALCSVNGSVVTDRCQLTQGNIIQLGSGTMLRFNHPSEAAQLREKRQNGLMSAFSLSLTDLSKSTENLSKVMLQNPGIVEDKEKCNHQEEPRQQYQVNLARSTLDKKRQKEDGEVPSEKKEEKMTGALVGETGNGLLAAVSEVQCSAASTELRTTAIGGKHPVALTSFKADEDKIEGGVSTREVYNQERDSCHKSRLRLMSERLWRKAQNGATVPSYQKEEVWSGDASLQQTSVLGLGYGCSSKPEGNANEIQGVVADCYKGRPGSGGSSLGSVSHLQSGGGTSSMSVLPQTGTQSQMDKMPLSSQAPCRTPEQTVFEGQVCCGETNESGHLKEVPGANMTETEEAAATGQRSALGLFVHRVSWIVQDAGRLLLSPSTILQTFRNEGLQPFGVYHAMSLVQESKVASLVKNSHVFSMVKRSFVFSLWRDNHTFSTVEEPLPMQHIQSEATQSPQPGATNMSPGGFCPSSTKLPNVSTQTLSKAEELSCNKPRMPSISTNNLMNLSNKQDMALIHIKQEDTSVTEKDVSKEIVQVLEKSTTKSDLFVSQVLIQFPESLSHLQTLPLQDILNVLNSIISTTLITTQNIVALFWLNVAKCSQPDPCPALLIMAETGLYTLTTDSKTLTLFHYLPLLQLKEINIALAGQSLRLMGTTEDSILGVYTHSQKITKELCVVILGAICPGDNRISQHPLLHGDLMKMSLDCQVYVPDLLMDAGLRVCSQFHRSLADLIYLLHCNMDHTGIPLGDIHILLYFSVAACISPDSHSESLMQLFLTDTSFGLVQVDTVFHPTLCCVTLQPYRPLFCNLTLRQRSDVRCVLLHDEDERGAVRLDVILVNTKGRGHSESVSIATSPPAKASNSAPLAEVWKLTFSCSSEAAFLINHLSNV
ncbi:uncharacterized protein kif16bb isoform X3 [Cynoglossus semilaevis]|nr:uncharacterized protein LOC103387551 isoform X3 [Cynoglossus semilaevis]